MRLVDGSWDVVVINVLVVLLGLSILLPVAGFRDKGGLLVLESSNKLLCYLPLLLMDLVQWLS